MQILIKYIRHNTAPVGCVVAVKHEVGNQEYIDIGWSYCSPEDRFTKKKAKLIAISRAKNGFNPDCIDNMKNELSKEEVWGHLFDMKHRAEKYFDVELDWYFEGQDLQNKEDEHFLEVEF